MVFSDFLTDLDTLETALQQMKYNRHEIVLFQVLHEHERTFEFAGMVKFRGLEEDSEFLRNRKTFDRVTWIRSAATKPGCRTFASVTRSNSFRSTPATTWATHSSNTSTNDREFTLGNPLARRHGRHLVADFGDPCGEAIEACRNLSRDDCSYFDPPKQYKNSCRVPPLPPPTCRKI